MPTEITNPTTTTPLPALAPTATAAVHDQANEPESRAAAERVAPDLALLAEAELLQPNIDVPASVVTLLGSWSDLQAVMPAIEALPNVDVTRIRKLRDYALALNFWQGSAMYALAPTPELTALVERGVQTRDRMLLDLKSLAGYGAVDLASLEKFGGSLAHRKLAQDLTGLSNLVHDLWPVIQNRSPLTLTAADDALRLGDTILQSLGDRDRAPNAPVHAQEQRQRAYVLFTRAYDEARRALTFLRWHEGDTDEILPSLYAGRRSGKKKPDETPVNTAPSTPTAPTPGSSTTPVATTPASSSIVAVDPRPNTSSATDPFLRG